MKTIEQLKEDSNKTKTDLLFIDAETALTFLDLAKTTPQREDRDRRLKQAAKAYNTILKNVASVPLNTQQKILLNQRLSLLRARLFEVRQL